LYFKRSIIFLANVFYLEAQTIYASCAVC